MTGVRILPEVAGDVQQAASWYDREGYAGLGDRFVATFRVCLSHLEENGRIQRAVYSDFRRVLLRPFPYALYYRYHADTLIIVMVIHAARDPERVRGLLRKRQP